jgi:folate-binding Fe-S cluster repair protein YgfZ
MPTIRLQRRALAKFSGPEAEKLLDDTLTGRMQMAAGSLAPWALLSPQGKVQAEGLAYRNTDGSYWLDFDREVADSFLKRMKMYRLRAKVEIADVRASHVLGWSAEPVTGGVADPRGPDLGFRVIAPFEAATAWSEDTSGRDRAGSTPAFSNSGRIMGRTASLPMMSGSTCSMASTSSRAAISGRKW